MKFYDFKSSGASLSAKTTKQEDVERHLFVFYTYGSSLLADRGMENKESYAVAYCFIVFARASATSRGDGR